MQIGEYMIKWLKLDEVTYATEEAALAEIKRLSGTGLISEWAVCRVVGICKPLITLDIKRDR